MKLVVFLLTIDLILFGPFELSAQNNKGASGRYRLNYIGNGSGWSYNHKEELLTLYKDSTFILEQISQNGFEVYPDSGFWSISDSTILLKTKVTQNIIDLGNTPSIRFFKITAGGLIELKCRERKLRNSLWKRE